MDNETGAVQRRADNAALVRRPRHRPGAPAADRGSGVLPTFVLRHVRQKKAGLRRPNPYKGTPYNNVSHTPPAMASGQPNSRTRQNNGA